MRVVEGVSQDILFWFGELALDRIHPRCIGRRPDQRDLVLTCPPTDFRSEVGREVVQDEIDAFFDGIARAHPFEGSEHLLPSLAGAEVSPEFVLVDVEKGQPLARAVRASIGRR